MATIVVCNLGWERDVQWRRWNAKSGGNIKKGYHFSSHAGWVKGSYFVRWQMLRFLGPEFIPNHRKYLQGKNAVIFGWLVSGLSATWLVCRRFGWFVGSFLGGVASLWVICGWFVGGLGGFWVVEKVCG